MRQKRERLREAAQAADDAGDGTAASGGGAETGLKMRLWEKCLLCGEKLAACTCANAQEPCLDCGETFARCMCDGE